MATGGRTIEVFTAYVQTTTATETTALSVGLADNMTGWLDVTITAQNPSNLDQLHWSQRVNVRNHDATVNAWPSIVDAYGAGIASLWNVNITEGTAAIDIKVTGATSTTINWSVFAKLERLESPATDA